MAEWKKVVVSGSSAELADLSLDTALTVANGGTGLTATGTDNFLVGNGAASLTTVGSNGSGTVVRTTGADWFKRKWFIYRFIYWRRKWINRTLQQQTHLP